MWTEDVIQICLFKRYIKEIHYVWYKTNNVNTITLSRHYLSIIKFNQLRFRSEGYGTWNKPVHTAASTMRAYSLIPRYIGWLIDYLFYVTRLVPGMIFSYLRDTWIRDWKEGGEKKCPVVAFRGAIWFKPLGGY